MQKIYSLGRPALFALESERAHEWTLRALEQVGRCAMTRKWVTAAYRFEDSCLAQTLWGVNFVNPLGMAAGFDKNARVIPALAALGFGFVEIGTVTPRPQPGNPAPRLFRLPRDEAVINRLGFPSAGAAAVAGRLATLPPALCSVPVGLNLGKNKDTPLESAGADYSAALERLFPYGDYYVVNVSSPNTPGLRLLQGVDALAQLLSEVQACNQRMAAMTGRPPLPCLLKIAPDLTPEDLQALAEWVLHSGYVDGIIATNTTLSRVGLSTPIEEAGGLSGAPLRERSTAVIRALYRHTEGKVPIIGVGGIMGGADAWEKIRAGASLLQVYSGLVYAGPGLVKHIKQYLTQQLCQAGHTHLRAAVGGAV